MFPVFSPPVLFNETIYILRGSGPISSSLSLPISFQYAGADIFKHTQRKRTLNPTQTDTYFHRVSQVCNLNMLCIFKTSLYSLWKDKYSLL